MENRFRQWAGAIVIGALCLGLIGPAAAVDPGLGIGAPGPGVVGNVGGVARRSVRR